MEINYNVKQVAELLVVNEEQVRRWIRNGKLGATRDSKKEGYRISELELTKFIVSNPKYTARVVPEKLTDDHVLIPVHVVKTAIDELTAMTNMLKGYLDSYQTEHK